MSFNYSFKNQQASTLLIKKGNTALHYFLMAVNKSISEQGRSLKDGLESAPLRTGLLERNVSTNIANKEGITASQIMKELKLKGVSF